METLLIVISLLLFLGAIVLAVITLVRDIRKKDAKTLRLLYLIGIAVSVILLILGATSGDMSALLMVLGVLCLPAALVVFVVWLIRRIRRRPGRLWIAAVVLVAVSVGLFVGSDCIVNARLFGKNGMDAYEVHIQADYDFEVEDGAEPLTVITSSGFDDEELYIKSTYRSVYDAADLYLLLEDCPASAEDCLDAIRGNPGLGSEYQAYFSDFVRRIADKHPDADLSILYHNLKTLRVVELDKLDYIMKSLAVDSYGCYMRDENAIYIPKGTEYTEGEWGFQVLIHEFCHAARTSWSEQDGVRERIQFCSGYDNVLLEESMNSVFSCSLLSYDERDIAYQVPSNYLRIMLECMDNYELSDYLNHSEMYFLSRLDEYTGYTNYAQVMWKLITLQRSDWENDSIDIPAAEYEPIYEFLCDMYYGKYITDGMTEEERQAVAAELADKAFFDAPEGYKINEQYFFDYLEDMTGD